MLAVSVANNAQWQRSCQSMHNNIIHFSNTSMIQSVGTYHTSYDALAQC